jgi:hypothetical protein
MCSKPNRIALIEPHAARRALLRAILADGAVAAQVGVFASEAEAQSPLEDGRATMFYTAPSPAGRATKNEHGSQPSTDAIADPFAKKDGLASPLADFAHAVRGSLGVIQNSVFVLRRKGADERVLQEFLELIEQQVKTLEPALADYVERARANGDDS